MKINKILPSDADFPKSLLNISGVPKQLYVLGNLSKLDQTKSVSVVGSRAITPYGKMITSDLVNKLASRGVAIISGLALGVDAVAHKAAIDAGGYTVAVMPCGLNAIHPSSNRELAKRILASGGALISEYPEGTAPFKQNFVARNRIVSGLGDALLITEASSRSGSLHTANFALDQGKPVMAVPGPITSNTSTGTNNLIKTGAVPVTDIDDILSALNINSQTEKFDVLGANPEETKIIDLFKRGITDINQLQMISKLPPDVFSQTMTMLEISGKIHPLGAAHWTLS